MSLLAPFDPAVLVAERPDGRTIYTVTWAKMLLDGAVKLHDFM